MKKNLLTLSSCILMLAGYGQIIHESANNGTTGDAVVRIESDKDNNDEGDNARIELYQDGGSLGAFIGFNQDWGGTSNQPDNLFRIGTRYSGNNYYNNLVIRANTGFIGLGTADPVSSLHISSGTSGSSILTLEADTDNNNEQDNARINLVQDGGLVNTFIRLEGNPGATASGTIANAMLIGSEDATARPVQFIVKDQLQMTVDNNGVGIGVNEPSDKLHVDGDFRMNIGEGFKLYGDVNYFNQYQDGIVFQMEDTNHTNGQTDGGFVFRGFTPTDGQSQEWMVIKTGGRVGIGTPSPSEELEVNGTIRSKEVKVEASPWPDYVFADGYLLPSLAETKAYISENHHLPDVPSAEEVTANGIALGEMNAILLKKIEELTLHVIRLEEQNEELKRNYTLELELIKKQLKQLTDD
ncbi:hypothetical protein [Marinoscillum sp.]|uniref:hypothetical protein n=1 Tax=Marinoscillum sp. TaxID=2024838 RepID=UPI003BAA2A78